MARSPSWRAEAGAVSGPAVSAAFIGSSNVALVHVAAALGAPWLLQTFMCPVRHVGIDPDDARQGFATGKPIVEALLESPSDLSIHHLHDPS
jgi:hypothetical protein